MLLVSSDNEKFTVDKEVVKRSLVIKRMMDDFGGEGDDSSVPIPLPNVTSSVLKKVLEWCEHHKNDPMPDLENPRKPGAAISQWDADFMKVDQVMLGELVMAANYLDIHPLLDIGCSTVADLIKDKSSEEVRQLFNIPRTFTAREEARILEENKWPTKKTVL